MMKNSAAISFTALGLWFICIGASMSSSIWKRFSALSWDKAQATVTEVDWTEGAEATSAFARISFVVADTGDEFSDSVFSRPWRKAAVAKTKTDLEKTYFAGATIIVRHNGDKALLAGFPEGYANWSFVKMLVGVVLLKSGISGLLKNRSEG